MGKQRSSALDVSLVMVTIVTLALGISQRDNVGLGSCHITESIMKADCYTRLYLEAKVSISVLSDFDQLAEPLSLIFFT